MDLLDARGLLCPLPVLRARDRLTAIAAGERLDVLADDPLARVDLRVFCAREGHEYLGDLEHPEGGWRISLRKGGGERPGRAAGCGGMMRPSGATAPRQPKEESAR